MKNAGGLVSAGVYNERYDFCSDDLVSLNFLD